MSSRSTVKHFLESFFRARMSLSSVQSLTGRQLEKLRLGLESGDSSSSSAWVFAEERHLRFAVQLLIWNSLTEEEQLVMSYKYLPSGSHEYVRTVPRYELHPLDVPLYDEGGGACSATTVSGGFCSNRRRPGESRCNISAHQAQRSRPATFVTTAGEEFLYVSDENDNYALVRGTAASYLTYDAIAKETGLSTHQVLRRVKSAHFKIETHPLYYTELDFALVA